jgi:hypothetical protein
MANDPDWVPAGVDILQANTARVYDYLVGGLVFVPEWRPDAPGDVPADPGRYGNLVGVARKP